MSSDDEEEEDSEEGEDDLDQPSVIPEPTIETNYDDVEEVEEENIKLTCVHCGGNYSSKDSLRSHKRIAHAIFANGKRRSDSFEESEAKKTTYDDDEEVQEEEQSEVGKKFYCDVCQGYYSTKDSLRSHKRIAHGILANGRRKSDVDEEEINKPFHCDVCSGNYSTKDSLRSHRRIAHGILANGRKRTDHVVNDSIESDQDDAGGDLSGSPETSDNESFSENKIISGR